jgi:hypothetical protein
MALAPACPTRTQGTSSRLAIGLGQPRGTPKIRNFHELGTAFVSLATFCLWTDLGCNIIPPAFQIAHIHLCLCSLRNQEVSEVEELSAQTNLGTPVHSTCKTDTARSIFHMHVACAEVGSKLLQPLNLTGSPYPMVSALHFPTHVQD